MRDVSVSDYTARGYTVTHDMTNELFIANKSADVREISEFRGKVIEQKMLESPKGVRTYIGPSENVRPSTPTILRAFNIPFTR